MGGVGRPTLYVGNKNYSSWSLRPWLALRWAGVPFDDVMLPLGGDGYGKGLTPALLAVSPTGRVPALHIGDLVVTDSLAITEWAAEQPGAHLWPQGAGRRALARSLVCEMHSGYAAVRRDLSMNIRRRVVVERWPEDTTTELARLKAMFERHLPDRDLFGTRTAVDAFYAPVLTRLRTYGVPMSPSLGAYAGWLFSDPDVAAWCAAADAEPWSIASTDGLWA